MRRSVRHSDWETLQAILLYSLVVLFRDRIMVWAEKFRPWEFWGKSVWMVRTNPAEIKREGCYKTSREANPRWKNIA
jgi:hypothetical protein